MDRHERKIHLTRQCRQMWRLLYYGPPLMICALIAGAVLAARRGHPFVGLIAPVSTLGVSMATTRMLRPQVERGLRAMSEWDRESSDGPSAP